MIKEPGHEGAGDWFRRAEKDIAEVDEAIGDFPFTPEWLDDPAGMEKLVLYCKGHLKGSNLRLQPFWRLGTLLEAIRLGAANAIAFREAVCNSLGGTVQPSSPRAIILFCRRMPPPYWRHNSSSKRKDSPWTQLSPTSFDTYKALNLILKTKTLENFSTTQGI